MQISVGCIFGDIFGDVQNAVSVTNHVTGEEDEPVGAMMIVCSLHVYKTSVLWPRPPSAPGDEQGALWNSPVTEVL